MRFLTAGESHGPELLVIIEGVPANVPISLERINQDLRRRQQGHGRGARSTKVEQDEAIVVSGVIKEGLGFQSTGAPIGVRIINKDFVNQPSEPKRLTIPRPGHADRAGAEKYGLSDFRTVRERASARETAARQVAGAVAKELLREFGIEVASLTLSIGTVEYEVDVTQDGAKLLLLAKEGDSDPVRVPDPEISRRMMEAVDQAKQERETLGGKFLVVATGCPVGLGGYSQGDKRLDGRIMGAVGSIPAVKGVVIGNIERAVKLPGSLVQDGFMEGTLKRRSNQAGGIEGGITNGEAITVVGYMKPLSSVRKEVESVDIETGAPGDAPYVRSDICAVPSAGVVAEGLVAWTIAEALLERYGGDRVDSMKAAMEVVQRKPFGK